MCTKYIKLYSEKEKKNLSNEQIQSVSKVSVHKNKTVWISLKYNYLYLFGHVVSSENN